MDKQLCRAKSNYITLWMIHDELKESFKTRNRSPTGSPVYLKQAHSILSRVRGHLKTMDGLIEDMEIGQQPSRSPSDLANGILYMLAAAERRYTDYSRTRYP